MNKEEQNSVYVKSIEIDHYGPYKEMKYDFRFDEHGNPIPLILIGKNGSGKTIFLSHIINAIICAKQNVYENCEVEKGKVYKLRDASYINNNSLYSYSKVEFTANDSTVFEWQLKDKKEILINVHNLDIKTQGWSKVPDEATDYFDPIFTRKSASKLIDNGCVQYFPSNRFEEPAWLNIYNLISSVEYMDLKKLTGISNRSIISLSTLKESQKWLFEVLYDRNAFELQTTKGTMEIQAKNSEGNYGIQHRKVDVIHGYAGQATLIYNEILRILHQLFNVPPGTLSTTVVNYISFVSYNGISLRQLGVPSANTTRA